MNLVARIIIMALLFAYAFPAIVPGVAIHGGFWPQGIVCGALFTGVSVVVGLLAAVIGLSTFGIGLIVLVVLQMFIPAVTLQLTSFWFPERLTVASWEAAVVAGLCIWLVNHVFGLLSRRSTGSR